MPPRGETCLWREKQVSSCVGWDRGLSLVVIASGDKVPATLKHTDASRRQLGGREGGGGGSGGNINVYWGAGGFACIGDGGGGEPTVMEMKKCAWGKKEGNSVCQRCRLTLGSKCRQSSGTCMDMCTWTKGVAWRRRVKIELPI